jgi:hypothetical protein
VVSFSILSRFGPSRMTRIAVAAVASSRGRIDAVVVITIVQPRRRTSPNR